MKRKPRWYIVPEDKAHALAAKGCPAKFEGGKWWVLCDISTLIA